MNITRMPLGILMANCYIIETEKKNAVLIDPGSQPAKLIKYLDENNIIPKKILLTHGHFDHIGAVPEIVEKYGSEVYIHENDAVMLSDRRMSLADDVGGGIYRTVEKYNCVHDGDRIVLDELDFEVLHTPGHTKGGVCYRCGDSLFTGDTLFCLSMGRTDFPGGSLGEMYHSLKRLGAIPGDLDVFPGHNETTTLDFERKNNPCLKGNPYEDII